MKKWIRIGLSLLWVGVAAEVYLRAFAPQPMAPRYVMAGEFGIRTNMPEENYWHTTPEFKINIRTNRLGIRADQKFSDVKPPGVKRIVVLGDSFGMGYGVNLEDSFTHLLGIQMEAHLNQTVEIINLSVSGFGTAEELLALKHRGLKYAPDYVLLVWHATDVKDNIRSGLFTLKNGNLIRTDRDYLPGVKTREFLYQFSVYRWLAGNSHFYNWVREFAGVTLKKILVWMQPEATPLPSEGINGTRGYALSYALLEEIKKQSEGAGAELVVLEVPIRKSRLEFLPSMPDSVRGNISVVNPISSFLTKKGKKIYWEKSHGHFTPLGCMLVANDLFNELVK